MDTLIVGGGAMGCLFAAIMAQAGGNITIYDINSEKVDNFNKNGIFLKDLDNSQYTVKVRAVNDIKEAPSPDFIIVLVKSYHTARAAREIALIMKENMQVLTLQNGLSNGDVLCEYLPSTAVMAGITYQGAMELSLGHVEHKGAGLTLLAPLCKANLPKAMELARYFNDLGISAGATNDLEPLIWKKLVVNSVINPLTAIYNLPNGMLPKNPEIVRDMAALAVEGVAVAKKAGIPLDYGEIWAAVLDTCRKTAENHSSMLVDIEKGRCTEIQDINGSIIHLGETHGLETPVNNRMLREILVLQNKNNAKNYF